MEWTKEYITGIEEIDLQHKELFELISKFKDDFTDQSKNCDKEVGNILKFLVNYTMFHFSSEEDYMKRINYTKFDEHKEIHEQFIVELHGILKKLKAKGSFRPIQLYYFLTKWLQDHIAGEDQKYAKVMGKITDFKIKLENKESILQVVTPNLSRIDLMCNDELITDLIKETKRKEYLISYYRGFKADNLPDILILFDSSSLLNSKKIITNNEDKELKKYIFEHFEVKEKLKEGDKKETVEEVQNYLIHYGLI